MEIYEVFTITTCIFEAMTYTIDMRNPQVKQLEVYSIYAGICLNSLKLISQMFPTPESYSHCLGYKV